MTEPFDPGSHLRPGFVLIGGRTIAEHQLDIALDFGCERIICLIRGLEPQILTLQHRAEQAGRQFHTVTATRELSALVTAADEILVLAEGLLADREWAVQLLEKESGVFVQPVEAGMAAGFERLDINNAAAGMLRIPGRLIENLVQLPADCDVTSSLTHIALQHGCAMREIPAEARSGVYWQMIRNEGDAFAIEHDWLAQQIGHPGPLSPGRWLARQGIFGFGPSLLHADNASAIMIAAMAGTLALALAIAWLGSTAGGFLGCAIAWILYRGAILLRRIERPMARHEASRVDPLRALGWAFDAQLVLFMVWSQKAGLVGEVPHRLIIALIFLLLIRLLANMRTVPWRGWLSDRLVLSCTLAICSALGVLDWAVALGAVALVTAGIAVTRPDSG